MIPDGMKGFFQRLSTVNVKRSALSPFIQLCLPITVPCILSLAIIPEELRMYVFLFATAPFILFVLVAVFFLFFDRDRLHTEEHLEKKQAMEIVESKSHGLETNASDLVNMVNPEPSFKALPIEYKGADHGK